MELLIIRSALAFLATFDFLNFIKVLNFSLHFSWLILFIICVAGWIFWEIYLKKHFPFSILLISFFIIQIYADTWGNAFKIYGKLNWYDRLTHFTGGIVAGLFSISFLLYLNKKNHWQMDFKNLIILSFSVAVTLSLFYELWEYFAYSVLQYKEIIIGETDTIDDLFFDVLGTLFSFFLLSLFQKNYFSCKEKDSKIK